MWDLIRAGVVQLFKTTSPSFDNAMLQTCILSTGYSWAPMPHMDTCDLLAVYAANLGNRRGGGPNLESFSKMVQAVSREIIVDNKLSRSFNLAEFSRLALQHLSKKDSLPLARNSEVDYLAELQALSESKPVRTGSSIGNLIGSVVNFSELLVNKFDGRAFTFHSSFNKPVSSKKDKKFVVEAYMQICHLWGVGGVALAMNFFKDSQASALLNSSLDEVASNQIGWFVKPDMHVFRFMLVATGREKVAGLTDIEVINLDESVAREIYLGCNSIKSWAQRPYSLGINQPTKNVAQWRCIEDIHSLAEHLKIAPLEIDRILYMVGSGKISPKMTLSIPVDERYQILFALIRKVIGEDVMDCESAKIKIEIKSTSRAKKSVSTPIKNANSEKELEHKKNFEDYSRKINGYKLSDFNEKANKLLKNGVSYEALMNALSSLDPANYNSQINFVVVGVDVRVIR